MRDYDYAWEEAGKHARWTVNLMFPEGFREKEKENEFRRRRIDNYLLMVTPPSRRCCCCCNCKCKH